MLYLELLMFVLRREDLMTHEMRGNVFLLPSSRLKKSGVIILCIKKRCSLEINLGHLTFISLESDTFLCLFYLFHKLKWKIQNL
jgi:hypothetical protein